MLDKRLFLSTALLLMTLSAMACADNEEKAKDILTYRIYDSSLAGTSRSARQMQANCESWRDLAGHSIPLNDIKEVVYDWEVSQINAISSSDSLTNKFAQWLVRHSEYLQYLRLAKRNEMARQATNDPWYYPAPGDSIYRVLNDITKASRAQMSSGLKERYALQLVRALKTLHRDQEIIQFWETHKLNPSLMKQMVSDYVAGAYYATGNYQKALDMYGKNGDVSSLVWCLEALGKSTDQLDVMHFLVMEHGSNVPIMENLQRYVWNIESNHYEQETAPRWKRLLKVSKELSREAKPEARSLWKYTEAFCYWQTGNLKSARKAISQAERLPSTQFMTQSIRALRFLIDARQLPMNNRYEHMLYEAGQWFLKQGGSEDREYENLLPYDWSLPLIYFSNNSKDIPADEYEILIDWRNMNYSNCYFPDVFRKLMNAYAAPRLIRSGRALRALQLVDMADNIFLPDSVIRAANNHRGATFAFADTMSANFVRTFTQHLMHPSNRYDAFYGKHGSRCNPDFWYDLTGTLMMRECRYAEAITWLKKVSPDYNARQMARDEYYKNPFAAELTYAPDCRQGTARIEIRDDYKLWFARKMVDLQNTYLHHRNRNKRAYAKFQYAVGLHNSVYPCWPLTSHYWGGRPLRANEGIGDTYDWENDREIRRHQRAINRIYRQSSRLMKQALRELTDKELLAQIEWSLGNYKTVKHRYDKTQFAQAKKGHCDRWKDY